MLSFQAGAVRCDAAAAEVKSSAAPSATSARAPVPAEVSAWTRQHAVPFTTVEAGHGFFDLEPLRRMIGDARIVSLGEMTHGSKEVFQMKHRLVEFLVSELGFSIFAIEANMPEARRVDGYVTEGLGDPASLIHGMYFWTWRTQEVLEMVNWMRRFNLDDAQANGARHVEFTGFDLQTPEVAAQIVSDHIALHHPEWHSRIAEANQALAGARPRDPTGYALGSFPVQRARGRRVDFSGWIKTENVRGGYAGLFWRADTAEKPSAALDNMVRTGPRGTTGWTRYEITLDVPAEATWVEFGFTLSGEGTAWFDDLEVRIDGERYDPGNEFDLGFEQDELIGFRAARSSYRARIAPVPHGGKQSAEITSLDLGEDTSARARELWKDLEAQLQAAAPRATDAKAARWAAQCARIVNQSLALDAPDRRTPGPRLRDRYMADNVRWLLDENPRAKLILWAHNGHVRRADGSMGGFLAEGLGDEMVVLGFATARGAYRAWGDRGPAAFPLQAPIAGSVEAMLAGSAPPFSFLDLRPARADAAGAWFAEPRPHRLIGGGESKNQFELQRPVARDYDVLVWIHATSPSTGLTR